MILDIMMHVKIWHRMTTFLLPYSIEQITHV